MQKVWFSLVETEEKAVVIELKNVKVDDDLLKKVLEPLRDILKKYGKEQVYESIGCINGRKGQRWIIYIPLSFGFEWETSVSEKSYNFGGRFWKECKTVSIGDILPSEKTKILSELEEKLIEYKNKLNELYGE